LLTLADDSGLEVEALGGAPGVYSARYAGKGATDADRYNKLLAALDGVPWEKRAARFRCVIALAWPDGRSSIWRCAGVIAFGPGDKQVRFRSGVLHAERGTMAELPGREKPDQPSRACGSIGA
jgi:XTP/dITP diphosphohydrolase